MGKWFLENITVRHNPINNAQQFGTNVRVKFRLRYVPIPGMRFAETPQVIFYERIILKETTGAGSTYWEQFVDQYQRSPGALTFQSWMRRYRAGYEWADTRANSLARGRTRLLNPVGLRARPDPRGAAASALAAGASVGHAQADANRDYLARWGGILEIKVEDQPHIALMAGAWTFKERFLFFTFGVTGSTTWVRAKQHLIVDRTVAPPRMVHNFEVGHRQHSLWMPTWGDPVDTTGFTQVPVPVHLAANNPAWPGDGDYL